MTKNEIALLLKRAREKEGITQKEAAERVSYSPQAISLWEQGKVTIKLDFLFVYLCSLKCDPISFLDGELKQNENPISFDNASFLKFIHKQMELKNTSKGQLEKVLKISKPTLNKIFSGENIISLLQFYALKDYFQFQTLEAFSLLQEEEFSLPVSSLLKIPFFKPHILISISLMISALVASVLTFTILPKKANPDNGLVSTPSQKDSVEDDLNNSLSSSSSSVLQIQEEKPNITIDYLEKNLIGFEKGAEYRIGNDRILAKDETIGINLSWTDKKIDIVKLKRDENYIDSLPCQIYIKKANLNNYFPLPEGNVLYANEKDADLEKRIDAYVNSFPASKQDFYKVKKEELDLLKTNLSLDIPYLSDAYFNKPLSNASDFSSPDYEILKDEENSSYVLIKGMKDKTKHGIYIKEEYEGIKDIRVDDYAFKKEKNPSLDTILFEKKPHKLGDNVFDGFYLTYLDFGIKDDRSYDMDMNVIQVDVGYDIVKRGTCFEHFKGAQYLRLPVPNETSNYSKKYPINYYGYFGQNGLDEDFLGFQTLMFSQDSSNSDSILTITSNILNSMKVRSLYIPKTIHFKPQFERDLYLRLIRYEPGYSFTATLSLDGSIIESPYGKFVECMALEYYLKDPSEKYNDIYSSYLFKGCFSLKGVYNENVYQIGKEVFYSSRLPEKIYLRNLAKVASHAFDGNYNLKEIHIYNNEKVSSLTIESNAFVYKENEEKTHQIEKIVFHNFKGKENPKLKLDDNYKSKEIEEVFIEDESLS